MRSRAHTEPVVLTRRGLNRALLARQILLERRTLSVAKTIERLVGLQAQVPQNPYVALWSRLDGFRPETLSRLIADRRAVRIAVMRSTIHLVTAADCLTLRPIVQPVLERSLQGNFGKRLSGLDVEQVAIAGRSLVESRARTLGELGARLAERWRGRDPEALANAVRAYVPLVQVPPRGLWGVSGQAFVTSAEAWLGRSLATDSSPDATILRYLAAFGPATVADIQVWSGLTRLREAVDRLRPRLRTFRDEDGRELLDVRNGLLPDPDTPAPPRFLPEYDNILLSHANRTRIVAIEHRRQYSTETRSLGMVLVDGFIGATWNVITAKRTATLMIEPVVRLSRHQRREVAEEGARLLAFAAADAEQHDVRFALPMTH